VIVPVTRTSSFDTTPVCRSEIESVEPKPANVVSDFMGKRNLRVYLKKLSGSTLTLGVSTPCSTTVG
jgi:hypothetical protein